MVAVLIGAAIVFASTAVVGAYASSPSNGGTEPHHVPTNDDPFDVSSGEVNVFWYSDYEMNVTTNGQILYLAVEICLDATVGYEIDGVSSVVHHEAEVIVAVTVYILDSIGRHQEFRYVSPNKEEVCPDHPDLEPTNSPEPTSSPEPTGSPEPTSSPEPTGSPEPTSSPEPTGSPEPTSGPQPTNQPDPEPTDDPEPQPGCNPKLSAWTDGGAIVLEWTERANATHYTLYRAESGGPFEVLVTVDNTTTMYRDEDVEHDVTYKYQVTATIDGEETTPCNTIEITAIPVFTTVLAGALAGIAGIGAYVMGRRRA